MHDDDIQLVPTLTNREKGRFVNFYCQRIREHSPNERAGIMRIIDNTLKKGVTPEQIQIALEHNEKYAQGKDPRFVKHIRSFFTAEHIRMWQTPVESSSSPKRSGPQRKTQDPGLDILDKLDALLP